MNRRSFLWQGLCSSVPFLTRSSFSQQLALPISKPSNADLTAFAQTLTGTVYRPGNPNYERLRKGYAAKFDEHPALVVHPVNAKDIQATLRFAASHHLPLAIRCGGHSYAAYSTCDGGIVLDMSGFRTMDISADHTHATIGGGMLCGAVEIATAQAGIATVLGQCPSVGVGGFLLGGGVGPLMSKFGLGCDNILAADLILADGSELKASAHENKDLYWAIRGGGGNFGVVTSFEVAVHRLSQVFAGEIVLEATDPRETLRAFRNFLPSAPDELTLIALLTAAPNHKPQLAIEVCYVGDQAAGEKVLAPLRHLPTVVQDTVAWIPYLKLEQTVPAEIPPSYEEHCSGFFSELDDHRIDIFADAFSTAPVPVDCFLIHLHGAVTRVPLAATPFPLRSDGIACDVAAHWKSPDSRRAARQWTEALKSKLPVDENGNYVNVMEREGENSVRRAYGANYARLQQIKARYDPHNLFSLNQNIRPA
ncbi:MAG TPA: FAD-binding oxidoreductase [Acidobacteriaceae bacterium]